MRVFVDTSALYALLDADDAEHPAARDWISAQGHRPEVALVTHNYVLVETAALVHRRLGTAAVRTFTDAYVPALTVHFVDQRLHDTAAASYRATLRRGSSLVDHVSFAYMREAGTRHAFTFDGDFVDEGFAALPP